LEKKKQIRLAAAKKNYLAVRNKARRQIILEARTHNMGIAASVAGRFNHRLWFVISSSSGGRNSVGLLVVILYFYFFIGQQFRAVQAMNSTPAAIPLR
jgi:hypothetical protein